MANRKKIKRRTGWRWLTAMGLAMSLVAGIVVGDTRARAADAPVETSAKTALAQYTRDITAAAEQGRFEGLNERQSEINRAIDILASAQKSNPVVLTDSQAIRDLVTAGIARRIANGDVPEALQGKRVLKLDTAALFHDAANASELVARLSEILSDVSHSDSKVVLVIDPIQSLMGPAGAFDGAASSLLRDAIRNGEVQCVGASNDNSFKESVASDETLAPLFAGVEMQEVTDSQSENKDDAADSPNSSSEQFVGDKVSSDLRELSASANAPARVKAILQVTDANSSALRSELSKYGVTIDATMARFGTLVVDMPTKAIDKLADSGYTNYLSLDRPIQGLGHVEKTTGDDAMLAESGNSNLDGSGVGVAILDSGITANHNALSGRVVYSKDFTGQGTTNDLYGHGTFVAAMVAANRGSYGGIATGANLINFRVLDNQGTGKLSSVLNALDAVMSNRTTYNIRVVNMSLGMAAVDSYKNDALCRAVRRLVDAGIVVVAAAGNDGKDATHPKLYGRIHSPGNEPSTITVGAANTLGTNVRSDDVITTFSSRGPTRSYYTDLLGVKHYDNFIKPDLVAPGNKLIAAAAPDNAIVNAHPELCVSNCGATSTTPTGRMKLSGTSVSSPIVAGAAAVLLEANPTLTPNMVKMILMYTAQPLAKFNMLEQGAGELNIEGAVTLAKLVRTDLSSTTKVGSALLTGSAPTPQSTIAGQTFKWAQGVIFKYDWAKGSDLITKYQSIYGLGVLIGEGVLLSNGVLVCDSLKLSSGVLVTDNILVSSGITMSDGTFFMSSGVLVGDGVLLTDGVLVGDGVLVCDAVLIANGVLIGNGVLVADGAAEAGGDNTPGMPEE